MVENRIKEAARDRAKSCDSLTSLKSLKSRKCLAKTFGLI
jgi:hypothetical protein